MATHDYVLANQSGSSFRTDLNNALAAVVSNNSNATEPSTQYSYELWADTNSGYLKIRNAANNAWIQLFKLDGTLSDIPVEGTVIKSTGESGGTKFLREDGDNSCSWQSISQTALTGSTNNQITTVTGANAIQGEATLTYDGSELKVLKSSGAKITLENTSNAGVSLVGDADRTGADDYIFTLDGKWNGTSVAAIRFESGADTTNKDDGIISFWTAPAGTKSERLRIESGGNLKINNGDLVIGTSGHGIDFSAQTQSSSTTDDELLDHYEKGKWTPDMKKNGVSNGTSNLIAHGRYIRVGKLVWLSCYMIWSSGSNAQGTSGGWQITGLPFSLQDDNPGTCRIYQYAQSGYFAIDSDFTLAYGHDTRWQVNYSDKFDLYTNISSADQAWNSGVMQIAMTGTFMLHE